MKIRKAKLCDVEKLIPLWFQMHTSHYKFSESFYKLRPKEEAYNAIKKHFEESINDNLSFFLVAEIDQEIIAFLKAKELDRPHVFPEKQKIMFLNAVVVNIKYRHKGIFNTLQKELEVESRKRGLLHIELHVDVMNFVKKIYKDKGYEPRQITMVKKIKK
ncbi:MAG: GNAT family N-acetyltransferase [bacterium]|nr:GNAT family N-acetyltransferase [bacterium]